MKLIADSGGTKTDWRTISDQGEIGQFRTAGIQPNYMGVEEISAVLKNCEDYVTPDEISEIYFYGAGCSTDSNKALVGTALREHFSEPKIEVSHDLLAAARALCGREKGIACILGTGSNSALFDGQKIIENVTSLGYLLGDEGSGTDMGKRLLKAYLRKEVPEDIRDIFLSRYMWTDEEIVQNLYQSGNPQKFVSQFSKFVFQNLKKPYLHQLAYEGFESFIRVNVEPYTDYKNVPVHFTGSVAFYFANVLRQVGTDRGIHIKHIVEGPIAGLVLYHKEG